MAAPQQWPADTVRRRPIGELVPYAANARVHSAQQIDQIAASIQQWGWTMPVLVDETGSIIAGHARVMAAKQLGLTEVPVMTATGWSESQRRAYVLADNKLAENAEWDGGLLAGEIEFLAGEEFDLSLLGFSGQELEQIKAGEPEPKRHGSLAAQFGVPPFTVLNARDGWWQDRKSAWIALGIQSELGRGEDSVSYESQDKLNAIMTQTGGRRPNVVPGGGNLQPIDRAKNSRRRGNRSGANAQA